jgi:hypothetical protein
MCVAWCTNTADFLHLQVWYGEGLQVLRYEKEQKYEVGRR